MPREHTERLVGATARAEAVDDVAQAPPPPAEVRAQDAPRDPAPAAESRTAAAPPRIVVVPDPGADVDPVDTLRREFVGPMTERYLLGELLGEGGFASVFAARHAQIPSLRLAVKLLRREHAENPDVRERFAIEAGTAAALRGPNVVRVTDVGETASGLPFMVMEYVNGAPLDRLLDRCGSLRTLSVARVALGVLEALEEAHGMGVIHRDLKPANVLVATQPGHEYPIARVLDFGIAKVLDTHVEGLRASRATMGSHVLCTPQYAAPEVLRGRAVFASDLYALGHMMVEMLEGQAPYADGSAFEVAARQLDSAPVPMGDAVTASPLARVIERACRKPLDARYASASDMKAELLAVLRALETPARRPTRRDAPTALLGDGEAPPPPVPRDTPPPSPRIEEAPALEEAHQSPQTIHAIAEALDPEPVADELAASPKEPGADARPTRPHAAIRAQRIARRQAGPEGRPRSRAQTVLVRPDVLDQVRGGAADAADASAAIEPLPPAPSTRPRPAPVVLPIMDSELEFAQRERGPLRWVALAAVLTGGVVLAIALGRSFVAEPSVSAEALAAAAAEAQTRVHAATLPPDAHRFTFTSNVPGGEVWFEGVRVGALPRFDVFGPATRPVTVEFRHPDYRAVEVTHTAPGVVSIRAPFSRRVRRPNR